MSSSDLKRKREESDDDALPSSYDPTSTRPAVAAIGAPTSQQHDVPTPAGKTSAGPAPVAEPEASPGITGVVAAGAKASGASKETTRTVLICGKEVPLCGGGKRKGKGKGKKRRGGPVEGMVLTAYKKELALACKANDMMSALDMYREMEVKGIKHDLEVKYLWLTDKPFTVLCLRAML